MFCVSKVSRENLIENIVNVKNDIEAEQKLENNFIKYLLYKNVCKSTWFIYSKIKTQFLIDLHSNKN